jgi:hypothetical protein
MRNFFRVGARAVLGLLVTGWSGTAGAQAYRVVAIDTGGNDPARAIPTHVMPDGTVVGLFDSGGDWHEFAWRSGASEWVPAGFTDLGRTRSSAGALRGVTPTLWAQTLPPAEMGGPGVPGAEISAQVWRVDGPQAILPPLIPGGNAGAQASTPNGLVVGWSADGPVREDGVWSVRATVWYVGLTAEPSDPLVIGTALPLGSLPGYAYSVARAVNSYGSVVGVAFNASPWNGAPVDAESAIWSEQSAFLFVGGTMHELDALVVTPGWSIVEVVSILDNGTITAIGRDAAGLKRPVVLEPVGADLNGDGGLDGEDMVLFGGAVTVGDPIADVNGDGQVDLADTIEFLGRMASGLPQGESGIEQADGPVPSETYMWYFLSQLYTTMDPPPSSDSDQLLRLRLRLPVLEELENDELTEAQRWNQEESGSVP